MPINRNLDDREVEVTNTVAVDAVVIDDSTPISVSVDNTSPISFSGLIDNTPVSDFLFEIQRGNISGYTWVDKFGRIDNVDTTTPPVDIWNGGGVYTGFPAEVETLEIRSSSANDVSGGTGAQVVTVRKLLDGDKELMADVDVTMNGTSWVSVGTQTYSRCSRLRVKTVGSAGHNVGDITLRHTTTTANIFCVMPATKNTTVIMADTVPAGKTLYVARGYVSMSLARGAAGSANVEVRVRSPVANSPFIALRDVEITQASPYFFEHNGYFVIPEKSDFKVSVADVSDNNTQFSSEYNGFTVDD